MRTKDEILKEVGSLAKENPRGGLIPDLADVLMIEVLIDIRYILQYHLLRIGDLYSAFKEKD
jgi:hypothetical protein